MLSAVGKWGFDRKGVLTFQIKDRQFIIADWGPVLPGEKLEITENGKYAGVAWRSRLMPFWTLLIEGRHYIIRHTDLFNLTLSKTKSGIVEASV